MRKIIFTTAIIFSACNNVDVIDKLEAAKNSTYGWMIFSLNGSGFGNFLSPGVPVSDKSIHDSCTNLSGIAKANCVCSIDAATISATFGLKGTFRAWLSIAGQVDAICNVIGSSGTGCEVPESVGPFTAPRVSGNSFRQVIIANTYSELAATGVTQSTATEGGSSIIWTGTKADGRASGQDCSGFTSTAAAAGTVGDQGLTGINWTANTTNACSNKRGLYCVRQGN